MEYTCSGTGSVFDVLCNQAMKYKIVLSQFDITKLICIISLCHHSQGVNGVTLA